MNCVIGCKYKSINVNFIVVMFPSNCENFFDDVVAGDILTMKI